MSYDITDNVKKEFDFKVEGKRYWVQYPTMEQIEELRDITDQQREAEKSDDVASNKELNDKVQDFLYSLMRPENEDQEQIKQVMRRQNIVAIRNFNNMITKELGLE